MFQNKFFRICLLLAAALAFQALQAEILFVKAIWEHPGACDERCADLLRKSFLESKGVAQANINLATGSATLTWIPGQPYSYRMVKRAMQRVGLGLDETRIRVRGTIEGSGTRVRLISLGDKTPFILISPIRGTEITQPIKNVAYRHLDELTARKLIDTRKTHQVVTIEGPLFQAHRSPPNYLIIEDMKIEDATEELNEF